MALPVTITNLATTLAPVGPFKVAAGDYPIVAIDTAISPSANAPITGTGGTTAIGQSLTNPNAFPLVISSVVLPLFKVGSPNDVVYVEVTQTDINGTLLANSEYVAASSVTGTAYNATSSHTFTFLTPPTIAASATFAIRVRRSGADAANYVAGAVQPAAVYAGGTFWNYNGTSWASGGSDLKVIVNGIVTLVSDAYYFFGRDSTTGSTLRVYKATDPSTSWSSTPYITYLTTSTDDVLSAYQVGATIHFAQLVGGRAAAGVRYFSYSAANDTISGQETVVSSVTVTGQATAGWGCSLVVRSNGEVVAFYNGVQTKTSGTFRSRLYYRRRTAVNTWSAETQVDANAAVESTAPNACLGAADRVHFSWNNGTGVAYRTLSAANALNTAASSLAMSGPGDVVSYDRSGTTKVVVTSNDTSQSAMRFDSSDNPTAAFATALATNTTTPHRIGVDPDTLDVTIVYRSSVDSDLYAIKSTNDGAAFGTPVSFFVGTIAASDANLSKSSTGSMYLRGGYPVVGYVVNDNGTWKYNENIVRGASDAWNVLDKSTNVTLSNSDKTATFGVTSGVRSTQSRLNGSAGKYYAEYLIGSGGSATWVGLQTVSGTITNVASSSVAANYPSGTIYVNGSTTGVAIGGFAPNDVISVAVDLGAELIWFRKNGGIWNNNASANPATGTNGISFSALANETSFLSGISNGAAVITLRTEVADYTQQGPEGFSSWMGEVILQPSIANAWNVNDKNSCTLSNGDKTATATTTNSGIRSTKKVTNGTAGKYYAEFYGNTLTWAYIGASPPPVSYGSTVGTFFVYTPNGDIYVDAVVKGNASGAIGTGDVLSIAWDTGAELVWCRKNTLNWNNNASADPATGVGGISVSELANTDFALNMFTSSVGQVLTVRTEAAELTQTAPSGFLSWMGETLITPDLGVLASGTAALSGAGVGASVGTGTLTAQSATTVAPGKSEWVGTGALTATTFLSRTNLITQSQTFDNAAWVRFGTNIQPNIAFSPPFDFTVTAEILETANATNEAHRIHQTTDVVIGSPYTFSVYAKTSITSWLQLFYEGVAQNYNLAAGTLGNSINGGGTATITSVGNGWYRCTLSMIVNNTQVYPNIVLIDSDIAQLIPSFSNASCAITIWGAQFESGSVATAYIPTTTTAVSDPKGVGNVRWNATGTLNASTTRTNLVYYSQALDNAAAWDVSEVVITGNIGVAPDGTMTADRMADTANVNNRFMYTTGPPVFGNGKQATVSIYAKAETFSWFQISCDAGANYWANFNVATGVLGQHDASTISLIETVGNGWYRCSITFVSNTIGGSPITIIPKKTDTSGGSGYYVGDGSSLLLWGVQGELGGVPTAYIPTTTGAVTVVTGATLSATGTVVTPPATGTGALAATPSSYTNLARYSQELDNVAWGGAGSTATANVIAAPDATITAELITDNVGTGNHFRSIGGFGATASSLTLTHSVYAKAGTFSWLQIFLQPTGRWANFNLATGIVGSVSSGTTAQIISVGDGWYRCSINNSTGNNILYLLLATGDVAGPSSYTAAGTGTLYLWGVQTEEGAAPTTYIPTGATAVSRFLSYIESVGTTESTGTGALTSTNSTVTSIGISQFIATGVLDVGAFTRTNLCLQSEAWNVAPWAATQATVVANDTTAPDGTLTAERLTDNATTNYHYVLHSSITVGSGVGHMFSIYAKAGTASWFKLYCNAGLACWANFDLTNGTVGLSQDATGSITSVGNGWYRCSIRFVTISTFSSPGVLLSNGDIGFVTYLGTGQYIYAWGAQLERGVVLTPYIPTGATQVAVTGAALNSVGTATTPAATGTGNLIAVVSPSATNIALQSEALNVSPWGINAATITANASAAPNDSNTAERLVDDTSVNGIHYVYQLGIPVTAGVPYTYSVYAKAESLSWFQLNINGWANFNVATGSVGFSSFGTLPSIIAVGNGWYRCSITFTKESGTTNDVALVLSNSDINGFPVYTGTGSGSLLLWGMQVELGTVATDYIPTTTTAVTRSSTPLTGTGISGSVGSAAGGAASDLVITDPANSALQVFGGTGGGYFENVGQTFIAGGSSISRVRIALVKTAVGAPTGTIQVKLHTVTAGHMPLTEIGASSVVTCSSLSTVLSLVDFTFSPPVSVTPGTEYVFTTTRSVLEDYPNDINLSLVFSNPYANGQILHTASAVWEEVGPYDLDCVISFVALGGLLSSSSTLVGTGAGVAPEATGTGTLSAQSSTLSGVGISQSRSTSAVLNSQNSTLAGVAVSTSLSTVATLVAPNRTIAGLGTSQSVQTLAALSAQSSTLSSVGVSQSVQTLAALTAQVHTSSAVGVSESRSTSTVLNSQNSILAGAGVSTSLGTATIIAPNRTMVGTGIATSTGTGALVPSVSTINGSVASLRAVISWVRLTATRVTITVSSGPLAVVEAADTSSFVGTVVNQGTLAVVEAADTPSFVGTVVNRGTLAVVEATDTTSFVGTVIGAGTGVLTPTNSTVASSGLSASIGTGVLASTTSTVVSSGKSASTGTGVLTSTSTLASSGTVAWRGTGVLTSTNCASVGLGVSASIGTGTLASTTSTVVSSGIVAWRGTGVLTSTNSTIVSLGVATSFATLAVTEAPDIAIFVASGISSGLLTVVEPPDTAVFAGKTSSTGTGALTSTSTLAGLGEATSKGALVVSEASDTAVIAGSVFHKATLVATEASDTSVIVGTVVNRGTLTVTEANDNAVLVGTVVNNGTLVAIEASDAAVIVGTVVNRGTLAAIEGADIAIFVTAGISSGVLTVVEAADTTNFNGTVVNRGTLTVVEAADTASFAGTVVNRGTLTVVEANDNAVIVGKVINNGALVALEAPDTAIFAGTVLRRVSSAAALFIAA